MLRQTPAQVTQLLWDKYHPGWVWKLFAITGFLATIAMYVFLLFAPRGDYANA